MKDDNQSSDLCKLFGKRLAVIRKLRGVSQERFAADSGLARSHVSGIERGKINVSLSTIGTIAETLLVDPRELFDFHSTSISAAGDKDMANNEAKSSNTKNKLS